MPQNAGFNPVLLPPCSARAQVLACLQILSRGNVFQDIYHMSFISFQTVAATFHSFCKYFAEELYEQYIYLPTGEYLTKVMEQYHRIGFPGAIGSTDVTHIYWGMCPYNQARMYTGKEGKPTIAYQVTVDHSGRVLAVTPGFTGATNDKTIIRFDKAVTRIRTDPIYTEQTYKLYAKDGEEFEEKGCYLLVDNGYHKVNLTRMKRRVRVLCAVSVLHRRPAARGRFVVVFFVPCGSCYSNYLKYYSAAGYS